MLLLLFSRDKVYETYKIKTKSYKAILSTGTLSIMQTLNMLNTQRKNTAPIFHTTKISILQQQLTKFTSVPHIFDYCVF